MLYDLITERLNLLNFSLNEIHKEYSELWDAWKIIEAKCQPIAAVSGFYLAGIFAYINNTIHNKNFYISIILLLISILLFLCIVSSLLAISIYRVKTPFLNHQSGHVFKDLAFSKSNELDFVENQLNMLGDYIDDYREACNDIRYHLDVKRTLLNVAIILIFAIAFSSVILIGLVLFK